MIMLFVIIMWRELVMIKAPTSRSRKVSKTVKKSLFFKLVVLKAPTSLSRVLFQSRPLAFSLDRAATNLTT